jgi:hypothetical protein
MNHPQDIKHYPDKDYDPLATAHTFLQAAATEIITTKTNVGLP